MTTKQINMTDTNIAQNHVKLLDQLSVIANSENLKTGNLRALKSVYLRMNLAYISLCEQSSSIPYMPSSKSDMLFNRYAQVGDLAKARQIVENRLRDIIIYIERV